MKVAYWPGCVSRGFTPELHGSMALVAERLGIELVELDRANCCGAGVIAEHNPELADTLNARTFAMAQKTGLSMMNICSTCQGAQSECQERLDADSAYRAHINEALARRGPRVPGRHRRTRTSSGCWSRTTGSTGSRSCVKRPLTGLRVGPFYGCYVLRPTSRLGYDEHPERDRYLEQLIEALGGDAGRLRRRAQVLRLPRHHDEPRDLARARRAATSATRSTPAPTRSSRRARCAT